MAHASVPPEFTKGPEGFKKWATALHNGIPDDLWIKHCETIAEKVGPITNYRVDTSQSETCPKS